MRDSIETVFRFVTEHNLLVLVLMLLLTAGVTAGTTQLQLQSQADNSDAIGDTEVAQKLDYVESNFGNRSEANATRPAAVYVRDADGNVVSKTALLDTLRFQQSVRENDSVGAALGEDGRVLSVANAVGARAAGGMDSTLAERIDALEATEPSAVEALVAGTLAADSPALALVPDDFRAGSASTTSTRIVFRFTDGVSEETRTAATAALHEASDTATTDGTGRPRSDGSAGTAGSGVTYFTVGEHAVRDARQQFTGNAFELVIPIALVMILLVLAFSYRDLVDVVVGFTGVALSVLWMFGILGWLQVPAGLTLIVGPVLIVGLSVDYGLHVFTRYREERGESEGIREPMARGLSAVAVALALVTLTAAVGFMSNVTNEFTSIKELSIGITLGVVSTFVVSLTLVPALKVSIDSLLERVGLDRRKQPLGKTRLLEPFLASGAALARKAAPVVIVLALVAGSAGAVAWTELDRQSFQQGDGDVAEWKQDLPEPLAWEPHEYYDHTEHVEANYRAAEASERRRSSVLLEGDVATPDALASVAAVHDSAGDHDVVFRRAGSVPVISPLSVARSVAAENPEFAGVYRAADTNDDGVPDENVAGVYDALFAAAPDRARQVVDRSDGRYRAVRVVVPISASAKLPAQADAMEALAATAEAAGSTRSSGSDDPGGADSVDLTASAVGQGTLNAAEAAQTAENILRTLVIALVAVAVLLTVVYRLVSGSATLGAVTAVPIALVTALVVGGMFLLDVPLTLLTTLLLSLVVGLGIDYNIHVSDRFAHELERGRPVQDALHEAVTGTGGALLGSTLTSVGAFSALLLVPSPQMQSFGTLVVLALSLSFVVAVFVLPSLLLTWTRYGREHPSPDQSSADVLSQD